MGVDIHINEGVLNLAQLQERLDEVVFDHIDTSSNWETAYVKINNLLDQTVSYFNTSVEKNNQILPKSNTFWALFMDIAARIIYFKTIAKKHLVDMENPTEKNNILQNLKKAVNCLPNIQKRNYELLKEISKSYEEIELMDNLEGAFEKYFFTKNNEMDECLREFNELALKLKEKVVH